MSAPVLTLPRDPRKKAEHVAVVCEEEFDLQGARLPDEYFYQSLPFCVIDAVYSIGVKYTGVENVVKRYCTYFGLQKLRNPRDQMPSPDEQEPLTGFVEKMNRLGIPRFTKDIFDNHQRTSSRNGILKSEGTLRFATVLTAQGINFLQDVPRRVSDAALEAELRQIPGQRSGISISYFFMLAGSEDLIKPDRWIGRFLARHLGLSLSAAEAQSVVSEACEILRIRYAHLTPRMLDHVIWSHERAREQ